MAGSAVLDPNVLVDSLVADVIDGLRGELHPEFGIRAYRASLVIRTWAGRFIGEGGSFTETVTEITPQPKVWTWDGIRWGLEACGLNEMGEVKLTEVSLTYTNADLDPPHEENQEFFIRITEAHGQGTPPRNFVHVRPPFIDREKDFGWVLWLKFVNTPDVV